MSADWDLYMGTILLDANRWARPKAPSFKVSEWAERLKAAGFDGMELWEYHATLCGPEELAALEASPLPVSVYNSYATMDDAGRQDRERATALAKQLGAKGIKFNMGKSPDGWDAEMTNLGRWRSRVPGDIRLLCECHPDTIVEDVADARRFFSELGMEGFGIIIHPLNRLETLQPWFDAFGPDVVLAHLQMRTSDGDGPRIRFDRRPERAREAVRIMREASFSGSCTFEFTEGMSRQGEDIEELFRNALLDLAFWKEIMAS